MKNSRGIFLSLTILAAGATQAATWYANKNNGSIDNALHWDDTLGAGGTNPTTGMNVANTDTWVMPSGIRMARGGSNDFFGTLRLDNETGSNDGEYLNRGGSNFETIILNGGAINSFRSDSAGITATTVSVTANGGIIGAEDDPSRFTFGTLSGSGEILIQKRGNGAPTIGTVNDGRVIMEAGIDYSGFTGLFRVQSDTSTGGRGFFEFSEDLATASFALQIDLGGTYTLQNNVAVTTLQLGADFVAPGGGTGPDGAYLYADFSAAQQAYFEDQGGSLKVTQTGTVTAPAVVQDPAESIDETIASIPGVVTDAGGETPTLTIYYDTEDGGTNTTPGPGGWDFSKVVGLTFGEFDEQLTGLTNDTTYFYRCRVTNSGISSDTEGWAAASDSFTTGTVPSLLTTVQNGNITDSPTWIGSPPVPSSGTADTRTWRILHQVSRDTATNGDAAFSGQTLEIGDGLSDDGMLRLEGGNGTLTVRDVVLNENGTIFQDRDNNTLAGDTLTIAGDGSRAAAERNGTMNLNFETYAGEGTLYSFGNNANGNNALVFQTTNASPGTAMQGFNGTIHCDVLNGNGGCVRWDFNVTAATFSLKLADTDTDLPAAQNNEGASDDLTVNGKMFLTDGVDVTLIDLHLYDEGSDGSVVTDVHLSAGTYTLDTGTNPDAIDLANVGGQDYSRFFKGGNGTVTVNNAGDYGTWVEMFPGADLTDPDADFDGDGLSNDNERLFGLDPTDPASVDPIVMPLDAALGIFSFTRRDDALTGVFSGVETSTDLVVWTRDSGAVLTPAAPVGEIETVAVQLSAILLDEPVLFVRVVQDAGVLFTEDFESDDGGFSIAKTAGTDWAHGDPDSTGPGGAVGTGNGGSTNCWGTDIGNPGYFLNPTTDSCLRSAVIDLTGVAAATLTFAQAIDLDSGDTVTVNIIDDTTDTVIAADIVAISDGDIAASDWGTVGPVSIPAAALGQSVRIEWCLSGTGGQDADFMGWYIDDVTVSQAMP